MAGDGGAPDALPAGPAPRSTMVLGTVGAFLSKKARPSMNQASRPHSTSPAQRDGAWTPGRRNVGDRASRAATRAPLRRQVGGLAPLARFARYL